jgi:hypothetical protein
MATKITITILRRHASPSADNARNFVSKDRRIEIATRRRYALNAHKGNFHKVDILSTVRRNADDAHPGPTPLVDRRRTIVNRAHLDKPMPMRINGRRAKLARREDLVPTLPTSLQHQTQRNVRIVHREHLTGTATQAPHARCVPSGARILLPNH